MPALIIVILLLIILALLAVLYFVARGYRNLKFQKQSQSVKYGRLTEQFMPLLSDYPYDCHSFRFIGTPIDGVQFNDDSIVFVEFKFNNSKLSERQQKIKRLVGEKKVRWESISLK